MGKTPTWSHSRRGRVNRSSTTVRLALHRASFDAVLEWVKNYEQMDELLIEAKETSEKLAIIREKVAALKDLFNHVYPKLKETDLQNTDLIELEQELQDTELLNPSQASTAELLAIASIDEKTNT